MADVLRERGLYLDAAETYRVILAEDSTVSAFVGLGICLRFLRKFEEARAQFERALALDPRHTEAAYGLANVYRAEGDLESAAQAYRRVLRQDADHEEARYFLAAVTGKTPASIPHTLVRDLFDQYSPRYDKHLVDGLNYQVPHHLRKAAAAVYTACTPWRIIDLGCGTGLAASCFRDLAGQLVGVDLSREMLQKAKQRGIYDELKNEDLVAALQRRGEPYNLAIAADVLPYLGEIQPLFSACRSALRRGGHFAFSAEINESEQPYTLLRCGRFAHGRGYLDRLAKRERFLVKYYDQIVGRREKGRAIRCHLYVLTLRPGGLRSW